MSQASEYQEDIQIESEEQEPISGKNFTTKSKRVLFFSVLSASVLILGTYLSMGNPFVLQDASAEQELASLNAIDMSANHLQLKLPKSGQEGKSVELEIALHNLNQDSKLKDPRITLQYADIGYQGDPVNFERTWTLGRNPQRHPLVFQSPGKKVLQFKNAQGHLLQELTIDIEAIQASVFPKDWEAALDLDKDPQQFHVWANLYYNAKESPNQRQYVQITYKNQIVDRFLVSSGAPGYDTPLGEFKLGFKEFYPRSAKYGDAPMPFWSAINIKGKEGEYGFHSLEGGEYLYLLGKPASHGCLRLSRKPSVETHPQTGKKYWGDRGGARWIFDRVPKGSAVTIFSKKLPQFEHQDYQAYLLAEARRFAEKKPVKQNQG